MRESTVRKGAARYELEQQIEREFRRETEL
jgi:hypothetical protein